MNSCSVVAIVIPRGNHNSSPQCLFSKSSRRLHLAHWLWKETTGYLLHPSIAVTSPTCAIADVGTANAYVTSLKKTLITLMDTRAWLLELVQHSPASWRLHGSDVSGANFPHPHYLPDNVSLQILDISEEVPREMTGAFDIVHVRALANVVKGGNPEYLIADLVSLRSMFL